MVVFIMIPITYFHLILKYNFIAYLITIMKCIECGSYISGQYPYRCCKKMARVCLKCAVKKCQLCKAKKSEPKAPSPKKELYHISAPKVIYKCQHCKVAFFPSQQAFEDVKCNKLFCNQCVLMVYKMYKDIVNELKRKSKDQLQVQIPVEMPCGCYYSQSQTINFLRKSCFDCKKVIQKTKCFELTNGFRIREGCYDLLKFRSQGLSASMTNRKNFREVERLLAKCESCGHAISEVGSRIDDIFICKECFGLITDNQSMFMMKKQKEDELALKEQISNKCTQCFNHLKPHQKNTQICHLCLQISKKELEKVENNEKVDLKQQEEQIAHQVVQMKKQVVQQLEQRQIQKQKSPQIQKQKLRGQKCSDSKDDVLQQKLQEQQPRHKLVVKEEQVKKEMNQLEVAIRNIAFQSADSYSMKLDVKQFQEGTKCLQCKVYFSQNDILKVFYRDSKDKGSIRIAETKEELQKYGKQKQLNSYCHLCYAKLKLSLQQSKMLKRGIELTHSRGYNSVSKPAKPYSYAQKDNFFAHDVLSAKKQTESLTHGQKLLAQSRSKTTKIVYCKECFKSMDISLYSIKQVCDFCKLKRQKKLLETQAVPKCKMCLRSSSMLNSLGYCFICYKYPNR